MAESENSNSSTLLFGAYILDEKPIGTGTFGEVYKARHFTLPKQVCIKIIHRDLQDEEQALIFREARVLYNLKHEHIVRLEELNIKDGNIYLIMEYMDGGDLASILKKVPDQEYLPIEEVDAIIQQIAAGLHYVHQNGIIHRDLKPGNVLRDQKGRVVIGDFGLAKVLDPDGAQALQSNRGVAGTPAYMAPEQIEGKPGYGSDLYSLGVIAYELLTKHRPFTGNPFQVMMAHVRDHPLPLHKYNPELAPEIEQVVLKMLAKKPEERYQSALDFARALQRAIKKRDTTIQVTAASLNPDETPAERLQAALLNAQEGAVISLEPGEYQGPFIIEKPLHLIGVGPTTTLYTIDKPVLSLRTSGVRLEQLVIQRARQSNVEPVIQPGAGVSYTLRHVTIVGGPTPGANWEDTEWQLPVDGFHFGRISVASQQVRTIPIEVKEACTLKADMQGLEVFPRDLPPGAHTITLTFNASGFPLGTRLTGSVTLHGEKETRVLPIEAQIDQPSLPQTQEEQVLEWPYVLLDPAARALLRKVGSDEEQDLCRRWQANQRNQELREDISKRAADHLVELVGRMALQWYVRRVEIDKERPGEEIWQLTLASDSPTFPKFFSDQKITMYLTCRVHPERSQKLNISGVHFTEEEVGGNNRFALPLRIKLVRRSVHEDTRISQELIEQLHSLPIQRPLEVDGNQLQLWEALLKFQRDQAIKRQYWAKYTHHSYSPEATKVTFFLDKADTMNWEQEPIPYQEFEALARQSREGRLKIFDNALPEKPKSWKDDDGGEKLGSIKQFDAAKGTFEVLLSENTINRLNDNTYRFPRKGYLHFDGFGDLWQIEQQQRAIADLRRSKAENRMLADCFFDARKARVYGVTQPLQLGDLLSGTCNDGQRDAIEAALAPRDLLLIQGPPGTGKTTVISEICYQVARNGGRALIASQSNLAVDNALGRLIHHPSIRALREGNPDSVEEEGRDFTKEYVVGKWLSNTARDCQARLEQRKQTIARLKGLLNAAQRFDQYLEHEKAWEEGRRPLQRRHTNALQKINEVEAQAAQSEAKAQKYAAVQQGLFVLLTGNADWNRPEVNKALQDVFDFLPQVIDMQQFKRSVSDGLNLMRQLDLSQPEGHPLRSVVGMKEQAHIYSQAWARSGQIIKQMGDALDWLSTVAQQQKNRESWIQDKRRQLQKLDDQISPLQDTLQRQERDAYVLQKVAAVLYALPQSGVGSIADRLQTFMNEAVARQLVAPGRLGRLEIGKVFPREIIEAVQKGPAVAFWEEWHSAESALQEKIQWAIREQSAYQQLGIRLARCGKGYAHRLAELPEISQELQQSPQRYHIRQETSDLNLLINQIEKYLSNIDQIRVTPPSIIARFFRKPAKQQLLNLFLETRSLLDVAYQRQQSIPTLISNESAADAASIAGALSASLRLWVTRRQQEIAAAQQKILHQKNPLERDRQRIQPLLEDEKMQFSQMKRAFDDQAHRLAALFGELSRCADIPEEIRRSAQQHALSATLSLADLQKYRELCQEWVSSADDFIGLISELWAELQATRGKVKRQLAEFNTALGQQRRRLGELHAERDKLDTALRQAPPASLLSEQQWWNSLWETIPEDVRPIKPPEGIFFLPFLEKIQDQFRTWNSRLKQEENFAQRYDRLIDDWVSALRHLSKHEREDLQNAYIKNANVIGITCGQAPRLSNRDDRNFATFDVVIIDEVSKATPPELLLPAIKGRKLILIGDRHQLPPMIEDKTLDQLAEESGQDSEELRRFANQSYFAQRYDEAADENKRMLYMQYRMHPDIMAAINQFYERPLVCGLNQPDIERDHQLESKLVGKNKHLIWIATPQASSRTQNGQTIMARNRTSRLEVFPSYKSDVRGFEDKPSGTSYINEREVEIIKHVCEELQRVWKPKKAAGARPKEIGVITFYGRQARLLEDTLVRGGNSARFDALNIRIGTVDRFQGMERAVIIVSMVRNNSQGEIGFAKRDERINVAFSRAQELLIIVGCEKLFCETARGAKAVERYSKVAQIVEHRGDFIDVFGS